MTHRNRIISMAFIAMGVLAALLPQDFIRRSGWSIYDSFQKLTALESSENTAMILVDQKTLDRMADNEGLTFPFPREIYGVVAYLAKEVGARAVVYDILFTETSSRGRRDDQVFSEMLESSGLPIFFPGASQKGSVNDPVPKLKSRSLYGGVHVKNEDDGIFRKIPDSLPGAKGDIPSLGQSVYQYFEKVPDHSRPFLHFYEPEAIPYTSFYNLLIAFRSLQEGEAIPEEVARLKDRVWIVGYSAPGLHDLKPTPLDPQAPGLILHTTSIENRFQNQGLKEISYRSLIFILLLFILIVVWLPTQFNRPFMAITSLSSFVIFIPLLLSFFFWISSYWFNPLTLISSGLIAGGGQIAWIFHNQWKERLRFAKSLENTMSPEMVQLIKNGEVSVNRYGEVKNISILFSDLVGFTSLSEKLAPDDLVKVLNGYLDDIVDLIISERGYVDKFIGDAVMAIWGAPLNQKDHPSKALEAALKYSDTVKEFNQRVNADFNIHVDLAARVGLHTADATVGNLGAKKRHNFTAIGDNVNLAARLESLCDNYDLYLLVSEDCYHQCRDDLKEKLFEIDCVIVKGKSVSTRIYSHIPKLERQALDDYSIALKNYYAGKWEEAKKSFIKASFPTANVMAKRCERLLKEGPGKYWKNGVWIYDTK